MTRVQQQILQTTSPGKHLRASLSRSTELSAANQHTYNDLLSGALCMYVCWCPNNPLACCLRCCLLRRLLLVVVLLLLWGLPWQLAGLLLGCCRRCCCCSCWLRVALTGAAVLAGLTAGCQGGAQGLLLLLCCCWSQLGVVLVGEAHTSRLEHTPLGLWSSRETAGRQRQGGSHPRHTHPGRGCGALTGRLWVG